MKRRAALDIIRRMTPGAHSSPVPVDTEAARAFYQERLALFAKNAALILFIFFCFANALQSLYGVPTSVWFLLRAPHNQFHLLTVAILVAIHLVAARGPRTATQIVALDAAGTIVTSLALIMMLPAIAMRSPGRFNDLTVVLGLFTLHTLRAVFVPASVRTTFSTTLASTLPLVGISAALVARTATFTREGVIAYALFIALWCALIVAVSTVTTRVIYGLREQVREARTLGQYTLEDPIGSGGMGTVFRARHAMLRRPTAIKLLHPEHAGAQNLARFEREVRMTSRLTHPNTVAIYDYGRTADGVFYYAMEYLDGLDLQDVVERDGPQDPARVVHILTQVCAALTEAHEIGLVHRDIKPANVILCERGGVPDIAKVVDFGLVKQLTDGDAGAIQKTAMGTIMGTPLYMSPEAILTPDEIDARSDLYAVGAVAYFMLTGTPVFEGSTVIEVCSRHIHTEPERPSTRLGRPIPEALETVIMDCLAKDRERRPESARELRERLRAIELPWGDARARAWWQRVGKERRAGPSATATTLAVAVGPRT